MRDYTRKKFMYHLIKVVIKTYLKNHVMSFTDIKTLLHRRGFSGVKLWQIYRLYIKGIKAGKGGVDFFSNRIQDICPLSL